MAELKDLPNEIYMEILCLCHSREILALIAASPSVFRTFQRHRSTIIKRLTRKLAVVPRPLEALAIADLRLMESKCKSTIAYEQYIQLRWDHLKPTMPYSFINEWPSDLPTLAVLADIFNDVDLLTEKIRKQHWEAMVKRNLGIEETWYVQTGLLGYELYCRLFYHGIHTLHPDSSQYRHEFEQRRATNFFPAIQFVYNIYCNNLLGLLNDERPESTFTRDKEPVQSPPFGHHPQQVCHKAQAVSAHTESSLHWISPDEKAEFLRYLSSLGIQFATKVSHCTPLEKKGLIRSELSAFSRDAKRRVGGSFYEECPRHYFPQPDFFFDALGYIEKWKPLVSGHDVYRYRYPWAMGPWFQDWDITGPTPTVWWESIRQWESDRSLTREYQRWMQDLYTCTS
ncbi:hypothetical protein PG997_009084 [Apiospora hydei]|uniref:F-box domain-containing protein n=1 Tax=Apiospora hydei TaxID=1337664 RepID=A0ABR1VVS4_9PEZI